MASLLTRLFILNHFICLQAEIDQYSDVIGIDLGTAYCSVAVMINGKVEIIPNDQGKRITPSYVAFADTQRLIGEAAKYQSTYNPRNTIYDISRMIGRRYTDKTLQKHMKLWPFQVINENDKPTIQVTFRGEQHRFAPEAIQAMLLSKMKQLAETYLNRSVKYAVLSVPTHFNAIQQRTLRDIGSMAGLRIIRILKAPTAAAIAYGLQHKHMQNTNIIVYDLGGGTLDVSAVKLDDGEVQVVSTAGYPDLGGQDFDERVMSHFIDIFERKHKVKTRTNKRALARLRKQVERAKRDLSSTTKVRIDIDNLVKAIDFSTTLTRATFEELNNDLFRKTLKPLKYVLKYAGLEKSQIHEIIMVGGSTRIPKIQKLIYDYFDGKEANRAINPDEAVVYGLAVQGGIMAGDENAPLIFLMDVTPFSVGIGAEHDKVVRVIDKNSVIPIEKSTVMSVPWDIKNESVQIPIYQGDRAMTKDNKLLGVLTLNGIASAPKGDTEIKITIFVDSDGLITVSAMEKKSGSKSSMTLPGGQFSQEEMDEMIGVIKAFEEEDQAIRVTAQARYKLESATYKIKNQLNENKVINLAVEDRSRLYEAVNEIINWLDHNPNANVYEYRQKHQKLEDYVQAVGLLIIEKHPKTNGEVSMNPLMYGLCTIVALMIPCGWYMLVRRDHSQQIVDNDVAAPEYEQMEGEMPTKCVKAADDKDNQDVKVWLERKVKLPQYYDLFIANGVTTLDVMQCLTKQELNEIGITTIGHRVQIINGIQRLKQESNEGETAYLYK
eukprot:771896_1